MDSSISNVTNKVVQASNDFEKNNSNLKRRYLIRNIYAFNFIASKIKMSRGTFGTGYPFYALEKNLTGELPIIDEQIRYNNKLIDNAKKSKRTIWGCRGCLYKNYSNMPDLKQICKPCPNMDNELKPRKVLNRLPDIDMWIICEDGYVTEVSQQLTILFEKFNIQSSDINPIQTIKDIEEIAKNIRNGVMPKKFLPIDAHIIEYSKIKELIEQVPCHLEESLRNGQIPYLPIHPLSYRKTWQYDDDAYNFVHDYLSSFTEYKLDDDMKKLLNTTRSIIAERYSFEQLYKFLIDTGPDSVKRRHKTAKLKEIFEKRVGLWKTKNKTEIGEDSWEKE